MKTFHLKFVRSVICAILMIITLACAEQTGPRAWIDFPLDGANVPVSAPVSVQAHAYMPEGVTEMMLLVNGNAYRRSPPAKPGDVLSDSKLEWTPPQEGDYALQVTAFAKNGQAVNSRTVSVRAIDKIMPTPMGKTPVVRASDLVLVSVEPIVTLTKGDIQFCDIRVVYRNAGTIPVPSDYVILASLDGRPFASMTRGAGFGVGGTSEATFAYQFTGSAYIGINLDSTNAVSETNESNNTFAEIRVCGRTTPVATPVISITPTRLPSITIPLPPSGCSGAPIISTFYAYPDFITQGQSAMLNWGAVTNADSVTIDPGIGGVSAPGSRNISPATTTTYIMTARCGANAITRQATVNVSGALAPPSITPTRTRTPAPPDAAAPPIPNPQDPTGGESVACSGATGSATLKWSSVSDPSGVRYYVKWDGGGQTGGWDGTGTQHSITIRCGYQYTWQVRACDLRGNCSNWSNSATFLAGTLH